MIAQKNRPNAGHESDTEGCKVAPTIPIAIVDLPYRRKPERRLVSAATGIKRLGIAVAAVVAAGFCALLALSLLIPADSVRDQVKAQIRAVTGLDPVLSGDVAVSLFPTGSVSFNNVSLAEHRAGTPALTAEQLVVRLRFFSFLVGQIEIADVTLVRPTIAIAFATGWQLELGRPH